MIDRDEAEKGSNQVEISRSSCTDHVHYQPQTSVFYTCWLTAAVSVCLHYFFRLLTNSDFTLFFCGSVYSLGVFLQIKVND